jgi:hypothetical protein
MTHALPCLWVWRERSECREYGKRQQGVGVLVAIVLNAYHSTVGGGGGGLGRYLFNIAGPLLSLAAAGFLAKAPPEKLTTESRPVRAAATTRHGDRQTFSLLSTFWAVWSGRS